MSQTVVLSVLRRAARWVLGALAVVVLLAGLLPLVLVTVPPVATALLLAVLALSFLLPRPCDGASWLRPRLWFGMCVAGWAVLAVVCYLGWWRLFGGVTPGGLLAGWLVPVTSALPHGSAAGVGAGAGAGAGAGMSWLHQLGLWVVSWFGTDLERATLVVLGLSVVLLVATRQRHWRTLTILGLGLLGAAAAVGLVLWRVARPVGGSGGAAQAGHWGVGLEASALQALHPLMLALVASLLTMLAVLALQGVARFGTGTWHRRLAPGPVWGAICVGGLAVGVWQSQPRESSHGDDRGAAAAKGLGTQLLPSGLAVPDLGLVQVADVAETVEPAEPTESAESADSAEVAEVEGTVATPDAASSIASANAATTIPPYGGHTPHMLLQLEQLAVRGMTDAAHAWVALALQQNATPAELRRLCPTRRRRLALLAEAWRPWIVLGQRACASVQAWPETGAQMGAVYSAGSMQRLVADLHMEAGDVAAGVTRYQRAAALGDRFAEANLVQALVQRGRREQARQLLQPEQARARLWLNLGLSGAQRSHLHGGPADTDDDVVTQAWLAWNDAMTFDTLEPASRRGVVLEGTETRLRSVWRPRLRRRVLAVSSGRPGSVVLALPHTPGQRVPEQLEVFYAGRGHFWLELRGSRGRRYMLTCDGARKSDSGTRVAQLPPAYCGQKWRKLVVRPQAYVKGRLVSLRLGGNMLLDRVAAVPQAGEKAL